MASLPNVEINSRGAKRLRQGHVWVFNSDIRSAGGAEDGDLVRVSARHGRGGRNDLGIAFYNSHSLISLRLIDRRVVEPDREFWKARIEAAIALRHTLAEPGSDDNTARLIFSEADGLPGLIVDCFDDVLVLQTLCAGSERLLDTWLDLLSELTAPRAIAERNDTHSRKLEGLDERKGWLRGGLDQPVEVREGGLRFLVDPMAGQKTGSYLDQRENHLRAASYARGRCLDVFAYQGGFGLQLARGGADDVLLVDQSGRSLEAAEAAARLNGLEVRTEAANAFDFLRAQQADGERYDLIVLDPPAFAKNKRAIDKAERGYKEINLRAMKLLEPGGVLITSSCSFHMREDRFEAMLLSAGQDAGRDLQIVERRSQARDHPERLGFPESRYLKCFVLRAL